LRADCFLLFCGVWDSEEEDEDEFGTKASLLAFNAFFLDKIWIPGFKLDSFAQNDC
jgi:hypothetical protein